MNLILSNVVGRGADWVYDMSLPGGGRATVVETRHALLYNGRVSTNIRHHATEGLVIEAVMEETRTSIPQSQGRESAELIGSIVVLDRRRFARGWSE